MNAISLISIALLACGAVPILSRAINEVDACHGKKIYIMDLGMFAAQNGMPSCDVTKARISMWRTLYIFTGDTKGLPCLDRPGTVSNTAFLLV